MTGLKDTFFRVIDYLRVSVTDRCNLRCLYCMPPEGVVPSEHKEILSYEEIVRIIEIGAGLGVRKVRLTGGEPLTRKNISFLISSIKKIRGIEDLSLTTNGILLEKYAAEMASAGLDRVNVSIDSFDPVRYEKITRGGSLEAVLRGISEAEKAGLRPIKINMVPIRGVNDDEVIEFASLTFNSDHHVRFIEFMPSGNNDYWSSDKYITTDELKKTIETIAPLTPVHMRKDGPSRYFRLKGARGVIGFISALTHHFCKECNRLRLTSDGKLRPCLFSETEIDLKAAIRSGEPDSEIERLLRLSIEIKPEGHNISNIAALKGPEALGTGRRRPMSKIGG
ncbi:MAG TPA: GTP 3',8-cyclase MoaA [Candidatus Sulfobium mesophilum]|nr:GTP 3',8-cyclase MoaA [Candidatus Sulfobium mesophilum]